MRPRQTGSGRIGFVAAALCLLTAAAAAVAGPATGPATDPPDAAPALGAVARLGAEMFRDRALSGAGRMSCASCHDPANHYGPSGTAPVALGGPDLRAPGLRAVPTLTYKTLTPPFTIGPEDPTSEANEAPPMAVAAGGPAATPALAAGPAPVKTAGTAPAAAPDVPRGGLFWDGRADTLEEQAEGPLLSPFEMANADLGGLAATIRARYGDRLAALFGKAVLADPHMTVAEAGFALARYQVENPAFHSFDSKYDAWLAGRAQLSAAEARGLKLFDDPDKGNCAACHLDRPDSAGRPPLFTDFEYEALGLPRNQAIPANADPAWRDLGLCGPLRTDAAAADPRFCGLFKTPTLRNVATRPVFFHNGLYRSLTEAVRFYALRDSDPAAVYPPGPDGNPDRLADLPAAYAANVDRIDAPFGRSPGSRPALDEAEIADIVAFLGTLTDGYRPPAASQP